MASSDPAKIKVADWWARNPMTYGEGSHGSTVYDLGTQAFFESVDRTFYSWNMPLHTPDGPFSRLFPYDKYRGLKVLEVGCGMGTMAMNWAQRGALVTAVDLNTTAVEQTRRRFDLYGLSGDIRQADGNTLQFPDESFDFVYSWGVLHHSPNLDRSLQELMRVLKSGGEFGVMLYNRHSVLYGYLVRFVEGFLHGESLFLDELALASRYSDASEAEGNPHTWPVTAKELDGIMRPLCRDIRFKNLGTDLDNSLPQIIPLPKFNRWMPLGWRKAIARRWGWSLWMSGQK